MRVWVRVIIRLSSRIDKLVKNVDSQLESAAFAGLLQTGERAYDNIVAMLDYKHDLQRLHLVCQSMLCQLEENELKFVECIARSKACKKVAQELGIDKKTLRASVERLTAKLGRHLVDLGYTSKYLYDTYGRIAFVRSAYLECIGGVEVA